MREAEKQLSGVRRVVCVGSGKGGVGKSLGSATAALLLSQRSRRVGLLDLDFYGPSAHLILGAWDLMPTEDRGVVPPEIHGVRLMSIAPYIGEGPSALRGSDATHAMLELLAITRWGELDLLLVDMPPGTGDEILDVVKFIPAAEWLVVSTPSKLSIQTVRRLLLLLRETGSKIMGAIENMAEGEACVEEFCRAEGVQFLGSVPRDPKVERAIGRPELLLRTEFARRLEAIVRKLK